MEDDPHRILDEVFAQHEDRLERIALGYLTHHAKLGRDINGPASECVYKAYCIAKACADRGELVSNPRSVLSFLVTTTKLQAFNVNRKMGAELGSDLLSLFQQSAASTGAFQSPKAAARFYRTIERWHYSKKIALFFYVLGRGLGPVGELLGWSPERVWDTVQEAVSELHNLLGDGDG